MAELKMIQAGELRIGGYIVLDNVACTVRDIQKAKTGKHGASKCRIEAIAIVGGQKKIHLCPSSDNVQVPIIEKKNAQVLSVQGNTATVMDIESFETFELKIPEEFKDKITEGANVNYWIILDDKVIMQAK